MSACTITHLLLALVLTAIVSAQNHGQEQVVVNDNLSFLSSVPECEDPELEAAISNAVNLIPTMLLGDMSSLTDQMDSNVIHQFTCFYSSVESLADIGVVISPPYRPMAASIYHQAVHYFNAAGGHDGVSQFLYETHELITYLQSIDFPNQEIGAVEPIDSWKKFSELQVHKAPLWDMLGGLVENGAAPFLNLMAYSPEKLARILYTTSGSADISSALGGFVPSDPFPDYFVSEVSNFLVAELEVLDLLIERGWLTLQ